MLFIVYMILYCIIIEQCRWLLLCILLSTVTLPSSFVAERILPSCAGSHVVLSCLAEAPRQRREVVWKLTAKSDCKAKC